MNGHELRAWMEVNGFSVRALARELDVWPTTIQDWRNGAYPVPTAVSLALKSLE